MPDLPNLTTLPLNDNQLTSLESMPQNLPKLKILHLQNNPIVNNPEEMAALKERFPNAIIIAE